MNCWDAKKCGREANGKNTSELGVCPAYSKGAGDACWLVAGTFCGGTVQGSFAEKEKNCMICDFYQTFDLQHRTKMWGKFGV